MNDTILMMITFIVYTGLLLALGIYASRSMAGLKTEEYMDEFYTGGRGVGAFVVAMVLASGIASAGTFVGTPGLTYSNGLVWTILTNWQNFMNLMILGVIGKRLVLYLVELTLAPFSIFLLLVMRIIEPSSLLLD